MVIKLRKLVFLLVFLLIVSFGFAQETKREIVLGNNVYIEERGLKRPLNKHILFVYDTSGSMEGEKFERAADFVVSLVKQNFDHFEYGIVAFSSETYRWEGIPNLNSMPPTPEGWAALPSMEAVEQGYKWITDLGAGGDTLVIPALQEALQENRDNLSIVLISDGMFHREATSDIIDAIEEAQSDRVENGLNEASIMIFGVSAEDIYNSLGRIATDVEASYYYPKTEDNSEPEPYPVIPR